MSPHAEHAKPRPRRLSVGLQVALQVVFGVTLLVSVWVRVGWQAAVVTFVGAELLAFGAGFAFLRRDRKVHRAEDAAWLLSCPAARRTEAGVSVPGRMHIGVGTIEWYPSKPAASLDATQFDLSTIGAFEVLARPFWSSVLCLELPDGRTERLIAAAKAARVNEALSIAGAANE